MGLSQPWKEYRLVSSIQSAGEKMAMSSMMMVTLLNRFKLETMYVQKYHFRHDMFIHLSKSHMNKGLISSVAQA
jgi:hypothetical protein